MTVTGGNLPYEYEWIGSGVSGVLTQDIEGLSTGVYSIEVTDANGCSVIESFNLVTTTLGCTDPMACNYESGARRTMAVAITAAWAAPTLQHSITVRQLPTTGRALCGDLRFHWQSGLG